MSGQAPSEALQWLHPMPVLHEYSDADKATLAAFGLGPKH